MLAEMQKREVVESALSVAKMANESKTVFLNSISHDIRTPMNGIIGMTAIAAAHVEDTQKVKYCLGKIKTASNHLLALISDVLDIARIESGRVVLMEDAFSLSKHFENMLDMLRSQINAHGHELSVEISNVVHEDVIGDSVRLQQVL